MSFFTRLASNGKQVGTFKVVKSRLNNGQKILGLLGFLVVLILFCIVFARQFSGKQFSFAIFGAFVIGTSLMRFLSEKILGRYKVIGTLRFEDDAILLLDTQEEILQTVGYDELKFARRTVGIPLTGLRNSRPVTADVQLIAKGQRAIEFETEWHPSVDDALGIEEVLSEIRDWKNLSP